MPRVESRPQPDITLQIPNKQAQGPKCLLVFPPVHELSLGQRGRQGRVHKVGPLDRAPSLLHEPLAVRAHQGVRFRRSEVH